MDKEIPLQKIYNYFLIHGRNKKTAVNLIQLQKLSTTEKNIIIKKIYPFAKRLRKAIKENKFEKKDSNGVTLRDKRKEKIAAKQ